jgi:hypothetical protein
MKVAAGFSEILCGITVEILYPEVQGSRFFETSVSIRQTIWVVTQILYHEFQGCGFLETLIPINLHGDTS